MQKQRGDNKTVIGLRTGKRYFFLCELTCVLRGMKETIVERMVGWGLFLKCNEQSSQFRLKRITKLVVGYR
jgi:hypothetical protein